MKSWVLPLHVVALLLLTVQMLGLMSPAAYLWESPLLVVHSCCWSSTCSMWIYVALALLPAHDFPSLQMFLPGAPNDLPNDLHHFVPIPVRQQGWPLVHLRHAAEVNEHLYLEQMQAWNAHLEPHTVEPSTNC